ncbi:MAG: SMC-Scp complex subunit ScpB [Clostridiales bacterium]|jgi:segregation and condensation protein B|nr:SMC-Scp complex subunit ScpB [Clostridiales bacterium]
MDNLTEILEAVIFTAGKGISKKEIAEKLPDVLPGEIERAIDALKQKYGGDSGVRLIRYNDKVQFSSNPKFGGIVSDILTPIKEKELSRTLLEVLAIVAYKQPVTRIDIEEIRGVSSEYAVAMLQKVDMIAAVGTKDAVGRPTLFGTTDEFLKKFCLSSLADLPLFEEIMGRVRQIDENYNQSSESLYRDRHAENDGESGEKTDEDKEIDEDGEAILNAVAAAMDAEITESQKFSAADIAKPIESGFLDAEIAESEKPDFLEGEDFEVIE